MFKPFSLPRKRAAPHLAQRALDATLRFFAVYIIPLTIGAISLIALVAWHDHYIGGEGEMLRLQVLRQDAVLTPAQAMQALVRRPTVESYDTKLSEAPVWFGFAPATRTGASDVEFPSRHAVEIECWDGADLRAIGSASRARASGMMSMAKSGFVLHAPRQLERVLCRALFVGPAHLTAEQWPAGQLEKIDPAIQSPLGAARRRHDRPDRVHLADRADQSASAVRAICRLAAAEPAHRRLVHRLGTCNGSARPCRAIGCCRCARSRSLCFPCLR